MKHIKVTLADVADFENLLIAHDYASQDKSKYKSVQIFEENRDENLYKLQELLLSGNYHTSKYRRMKIIDSGKEREISKLPYYPDRIVHWAIMLQLEPAFMSAFTNNSHAAIKNHGVHTALYQVRRALYTDKQGTKYCMKLDVSKYFPHINHAILKTFIAKMVKDYDLRMLIYEIIDSDDQGGVPIGNYLSQYFANLYLSYFDRWVFEELGVKHYVRYMDDMCFFAESKDTLRKWFREIEWYLRRNLYLEIKDNWQIFPIFGRNGRHVDFLGYRIKENLVLLRKRTWLNMQRKMRFINSIIDCFDKIEDVPVSIRGSISSYFGWILYCSRNVRIKIFNKYFRNIFKRFKLDIPYPCVYNKNQPDRIKHVHSFDGHSKISNFQLPLTKFEKCTA